ncbi:hypothetical protein SAMN05421793_15021 [Epilithonimonas hominis]|uniref:Uncharacterized protein n=1 Tax=Epilithonimonas hominis TaxID=420404 RepID=A0A1H6LRC1_9FLAO|nr:hypothetical protein SAMN05421793_15021 [Epilithonimonas hominis]
MSNYQKEKLIFNNLKSQKNHQYPYKKTKKTIKNQHAVIGILIQRKILS